MKIFYDKTTGRDSLRNFVHYNDDAIDLKTRCWNN